MQLKDIANMEEYLEKDCYCPDEIYDVTGIFFQVFSPEDSCKIIYKGSYKDDDITMVICKNQIINFWIENNKKIINAERYDATENNINQMIQLLQGKIQKIQLDEFEEGATEKSLNDIMSIADAIIID